MVTIYARRGVCIDGRNLKPGDSAEVSEILARQLCDRLGDPCCQREPVAAAPAPASKAKAKE